MGATIVKLNTLIADRIAEKASLAGTPRPIIDAVCREFIEEVSCSCSSNMTVYDICEDVRPCDVCGEIFAPDDLIPIDDTSDDTLHVCKVCHDDGLRPAPKTEPGRT
jgi:hypothetical protein